MEIKMYLAIDPPTITAQQKGVKIINGHPWFYEKPEVKRVRQTLEWAMKKYVPDEPLQGPVHLTVHWGIVTKDKMKLRKRYKDTRPDLDNMLKLLQDCLTEMKFFKDDAQVVELNATKVWSEQGFIEINIRELKGGDVG